MIRDTQLHTSQHLSLLAFVCVAVMFVAAMSLDSYDQHDLSYPFSAYAFSASGTASVGTVPISAVMFDGNTGELYISSIDNKLRIVDPSTTRVRQTITLDSYPFDIVKNPTADTIYLSMHYNNAVTILDASDRTVIGTINGLSQPWGIGVNPNSNTAYIVNAYSKELTVLNGATNQIDETIKLGPRHPMYIAVNNATNMVYVTAVGLKEGTLHVIDGSNNSPVENIEVGITPAGVGVNTKTNKVYVANYRSSTVSVIDGDTNQIIREINVPSFPYRVKIDEGTNTVFVSNFHSGTVAVIDGSSDRIIKNVKVGQKPMHLALNDFTKDLYVSDWRTEKIHSVSKGVGGSSP